MVRAGMCGGLYSRLNRSQRKNPSSALTTPGKQPFNEKAKKIKSESKAVEYAFLKCHDSEHPFFLKWDSIIADGIVMLQEEDEENDVRDAIQKSLQKKYALIGKDDFEFKKVRRKRVTDVELAPNLSFSYPVIKKMTSQGVLYIQVKAGLEVYYKPDSADKSNFLFSGVNEEIPPTVVTQVYSSCQNIPSGTNMNQEDSVVLSSSINKTELSDESKQFINDIKGKNLQTLVKILKFLQKVFVKGTPLDVADLNKAPEGEQTIFVWTEKTFYSLHLQNWSQSQTIVSHLKLISWERWPKTKVGQGKSGQP